MVNGHNNTVSLGSSGSCLNGRPGPTMYTTALIFRVLRAASGTKIRYGHANDEHGICILVFNQSDSKLDDGGPWKQEEADHQ